jgi:hypothetical protein
MAGDPPLKGVDKNQRVLPASLHEIPSLAR